MNYFEKLNMLLNSSPSRSSILNGDSPFKSYTNGTSSPQYNPAVSSFYNVQNDMYASSAAMSQRVPEISTSAMDYTRNGSSWYPPLPGYNQHALPPRDKLESRYSLASTPTKREPLDPDRANLDDSLGSRPGDSGTPSTAQSESDESNRDDGGMFSERSAHKKKPIPVPEDLKDDTYWDKRKKNNDSARRSRESRRMKEEQIAMRTVYLEQENLQLKTEVTLLRSEIDKLRCMLYNS